MSKPIPWRLPGLLASVVYKLGPVDKLGPSHFNRIMLSILAFAGAQYLKAINFCGTVYCPCLASNQSTFFSVEGWLFFWQSFDFKWWLLEAAQ